MRPIDLLFHALNFAAPVFGVAICVVVGSRMLLKKRAWAPTVQVQCLIGSAAGLVALSFGLWFFGNDGKMASYAMLVLAVASTQWLLLRGWRN